MSVALVAIVKNERHVLPRLFDSVRGICDTFVISDTGSTDGTQDWLMEQTGLHGYLYDDPWVNMEHNRTKVLERAKGKADWLLLMDADMTASGTLSIPERDDVDAYLLRLPMGPVEFWVDRLISGRRDWCFRGYAHEYLDTVDHSRYTRERLPGLDIVHHADGSNRAVKWERSTTALLRDLEEHPERRNRTLFYLANNHRDMGKTGEAVQYYQQRVDAGGWPEEVYLSMVQLGKLTGNREWFWKAYRFRPSRREALVELGRSAGNVPENHTDILFVDNSTL